MKRDNQNTVALSSAHSASNKDDSATHSESGTQSAISTPHSISPTARSSSSSRSVFSQTSETRSEISSPATSTSSSTLKSSAVITSPTHLSASSSYSSHPSPSSSSSSSSIPHPSSTSSPVSSSSPDGSGENASSTSVFSSTSLSGRPTYGPSSSSSLSAHSEQEESTRVSSSRSHTHHATPVPTLSGSSSTHSEYDGSTPASSSTSHTHRTTPAPSPPSSSLDHPQHDNNTADQSSTSTQSAFITKGATQSGTTRSSRPSHRSSKTDIGESSGPPAPTGSPTHTIATTLGSPTHGPDDGVADDNPVSTEVVVGPAKNSVLGAETTPVTVIIPASVTVESPASSYTRASEDSTFDSDKHGAVHAVDEADPSTHTADGTARETGQRPTNSHGGKAPLSGHEPVGSGTSLPNASNGTDDPSDPNAPPDGSHNSSHSTLIIVLVALLLLLIAVAAGWFLLRRKRRKKRRDWLPVSEKRISDGPLSQSVVRNLPSASRDQLPAHDPDANPSSTSSRDDISLHGDFRTSAWSLSYLPADSTRLKQLASHPDLLVDPFESHEDHSTPRQAEYCVLLHEGSEPRQARNYPQINTDETSIRDLRSSLALYHDDPFRDPTDQQAAAVQFPQDVMSTESRFSDTTSISTCDSSAAIHSTSDPSHFLEELVEFAQADKESQHGAFPRTPSIRSAASGISSCSTTSSKTERNSLISMSTCSSASLAFAQPQATNTLNQRGYYVPNSGTTIETPLAQRGIVCQPNLISYQAGFSLESLVHDKFGNYVSTMRPMNAPSQQEEDRRILPAGSTWMSSLLNNSQRTDSPA